MTLGSFICLFVCLLFFYLFSLDNVKACTLIINRHIISIPVDR